MSRCSLIDGYAEDALLAVLQGLSANQRRAFNAGCLELLVRRFSAEIQLEEYRTEIGAVVEQCWVAASERPDEAALEHALSVADAILEGDGAENLGVGEHVVAGVYYAARCAIDADEGYAELVAKNLYEAADFVVIGQHQDSEALGGTTRDIVANPLVQKTLMAIDQILAAVTRCPNMAGEAALYATAEIRSEVDALDLPLR